MLPLTTPSTLASRQGALEQLAAFVPRAAHHYGAMRNYDEGPGPRQHVSGLSAAISRRLIAESEVISAVLAAHPDNESSCHPFLREVLWRGYWRSYLEHRPDLWTNYRQMLADHPPSRDAAYQKAVQGHSGIDVFDGWVHELKTEGYLHNHARLWFASLWIHTLRLPWQWGASWFLEHLLDGDPASNTLSWRWVAGLHTKGKAYLATESNITQFTHQRLKPHLPPSSPVVPTEYLSEHPSTGTHEPRSSQTLTGHLLEPDDALLLLGDDLSVETLKDLASHPFRAVACLSAQTVAEAFGWSSKVRQFHENALQDTAQRAQRIWPQSTWTVLPDSLSDRASIWTSWQARGIKRLVYPAPFAGPYHEILRHLRSELQTFKLVALSRSYDECLIPLGKKGFFDFWNRRPPWEKLRELEQNMNMF